MPNLRHEQLAHAAGKLIGGEWETYSFTKAVNCALYEGGEHGIVFGGCPFAIPDRYSIDKPNRNVRVIEVGGIRNYETRLDVAHWFDNTMWTFQMYWVHQSTGAIILLVSDKKPDRVYVPSFDESRDRGIFIGRVAPDLSYSAVPEAAQRQRQHFVARTWDKYQKLENRICDMTDAEYNAYCGSEGAV